MNEKIERLIHIVSIVAIMGCFFWVWQLGLQFIDYLKIGQIPPRILLLENMFWLGLLGLNIWIGKK